MPSLDSSFSPCVDLAARGWTGQAAHLATLGLNLTGNNLALPKDARRLEKLDKLQNSPGQAVIPTTSQSIANPATP